MDILAQLQASLAAQIAAKQQAATPDVVNEPELPVSGNQDAGKHQCEACEGYFDKVKTFKAMNWCDECYAREKAADDELKAGAEARVQAERERARQVMELRKQPESAINCRADYFNAEVQSHLDLFKEIDADDSITNKMFEKAVRLKARLEHTQKVLMEVREQELQLNSTESAINITLNQLANKLREEEREKLKLSDINYKPNQVVVKPKESKPRAPKVNDNELIQKCREAGVGPFVQVVKIMMSTNKGWTIERAITEFKSIQSKTSN